MKYKKGDIVLVLVKAGRPYGVAKHFLGQKAIIKQISNGDRLCYYTISIGEITQTIGEDCLRPYTELGRALYGC